MQAAIPTHIAHVDVMGMPAPGPLLAILEALEQMPDGGAVHVRMDADLPPLARILQEFDYCRDGGWLDDGSFGLRIWRASPTAPRAAAHGLTFCLE
ncbi:MAG: hypothetical protein K2X55_14765 [Burkholderiaceae bacterium]|nr:hypothetical protein [Burkholderiaceae bacterium]